ncbi:bestrophin-like domain [Teichococcus oryzae]|uniref:DUF4239 domain-containing protein n=1 Tax=Teichococcus oryzae TaxID=1608942 RepID=A0A5B2TFW5_9PROT|nr:hypothetical protein [Pseudoroseomonas oryzae]KAA2212885.1 hypothetical protein F0Q34_12195 [Pseudoroseomonas oryzae]
MNDIIASLVAAGCVFAGGVVGLQLHRVLPSHHLTKETLDVIRIGMGMISVLTSLVFGLLIATAKSASDSADREMRAYAAETILLDRTLQRHGDEAAASRALLRRSTERILQDLWPGKGARFVGIDDASAGALLEQVQDAIQDLAAGDPHQAWIRQQALQSALSLLRQRWLLIEQAGPTVRPVILGIVIIWTVAILVSFGLNSPRNGTVVATFLVIALAIGAAVFLILEMDSQFAGVLRLSEQPLLRALAELEGGSPGPDGFPRRFAH